MQQKKIMARNRMVVEDDNFDELFFQNHWATKCVKPYFQPGPLSQALTIQTSRTSRVAFAQRKTAV